LFYTVELQNSAVDDVTATEAETPAELQELRVLHEMREREHQARAMAELISPLA